MGGRGPEVVEVYLAELPDPSDIEPDHEWYPVEDLAGNDRFIQHQLGHIQMAADVYQRKETSSSSQQ